MPSTRLPIRTISVMLAASTLSACAGVPLTSMLKLSRLLPLEADPAQIRVAVRADRAIALRTGDVTMGITYEAADNALSLQEEFVVQVDRGAILPPELLRGLGEKEAVTIMALSDSDARRFSRTQAKIRGAEANAEGGEGGFSLGVTYGCTNGPLPTEELLIDIYLQTALDDEFFVMNADVDLYATVMPDGQEIPRWPECEDDAA
ncbi:MAG: hypothetical protein AAGE01_17955 [Pseudomonadota bacterium]